jgi:hypothetical protein
LEKAGFAKPQSGETLIWQNPNLKTTVLQKREITKT